MRFSFNNKLLFLVSVFGNLCGVNAKGRVFLAPEGDAVEGWIVVPVKTDRDQTTSAVALELTADNPSMTVTKTLDTIDCILADMTIDDAEKLAENSQVAYVEQNMVVRYPDGEDIGRGVSVGSWGLDRIDQRNLPLNTEYQAFGEGNGVRAYIFDTGIRIDHNDFGGRAEWGTNTVDGVNDDCNGHGTHVAGTVGGKTYGVAKAVELVAVKVLSCNGSGSTSGILTAIEWAINDAAQKNKPATANFSLGGGFSQSFNNAVKILHESGMVTVAAAGNSNNNACNASPASERSIITVGSTTTSDSRSGFSNYGTCVDIFAPGSGITAPWKDSDDAIKTISGTSMASPHVCGAAALYLENHEAGDVPGILMETATNDKLTDVRGSPNKLLFVSEDTTSSPVASPTTSSPVASPTTSSPISTPTTSSPVASPTTRSPTANEPLPLSWLINYESSGVEQGKIVVDYKISNRMHDVYAFDEGCENLLPDGLLDVSTAHNDLSGGFAGLRVDVELNQTAIEDDETIWTPDAGGVGGSFKFCLLTSLYKGDIKDDDHRVTRKDILFDVSVSNVLSFSEGGITVVAEDVTEVDVSIEYKGEIDVYQCDEQGEAIEAVPIGPFDLLNICVKVKDDENMQVTEIVDFVVKQGGFSFPAIQNGVIDDLDVDIVTKDCIIEGLCRVSMQPVAAFFAVPEALTVSGSVRVGNALSRSVEEKDFKLTVMLVQEPCDDSAGLKTALRKVFN